MLARFKVLFFFVGHCASEVRWFLEMGSRTVCVFADVWNRVMLRTVFSSVLRLLSNVCCDIEILIVVTKRCWVLRMGVVMQ